LFHEDRQTDRIIGGQTTKIIVTIRNFEKENNAISNVLCSFDVSKMVNKSTVGICNMNVTLYARNS
jgi:hypothetical protein